ncbi:dynein regulatory complex protein 8-like [Daktulosphaira vitifoliae]|uniref:dynein regulatory complex protein 8-like n=1 Tax=Daktulosphaira vitifoliae TaxID=58002 RepID=UPI0021AB0A7B|nr:dynein regulatory complex protein 8-like [Daktulosphaira vitifoliae]
MSLPNCGGNDENVTPSSIIKNNDEQINPMTASTTTATIADAFDIFDHSGNRTIDVRELGTVLRYLGYVPSQADLRELAVNVEDHEVTGTVHLAAFLPYVENAISEYKYQPASATELLNAFRALDPEKTGMISRECMESALRHDGEPFEDEEIEEMMSVAAIETATGETVIPYEVYINKILVTKWDSEQYKHTYNNTVTPINMAQRKNNM